MARRACRRSVPLARGHRQRTHARLDGSAERAYPGGPRRAATTTPLLGSAARAPGRRTLDHASADQRPALPYATPRCAAPGGPLRARHARGRGPRAGGSQHARRGRSGDHRLVLPVSRRAPRRLRTVPWWRRDVDAPRHRGRDRPRAGRAHSAYPAFDRRVGGRRLLLLREPGPGFGPRRRRALPPQGPVPPAWRRPRSRRDGVRRGPSERGHRVGAHVARRTLGPVPCVQGLDAKRPLSARSPRSGARSARRHRGRARTHRRIRA